MAFQFILEDPAKAFSTPPNLSTPLALPPRVFLHLSASGFSRPFAATYKDSDQIPWPQIHPSHSLESSLPHAHSFPESGPHPLHPTSYPSSYLTFFDSLKPKPVPSISHDSNCEYSQLSSLASPGRCTENVEDVLMQLPPSGNPLFSSPRASRNTDLSSSTPLHFPESPGSRIPSPSYTTNFPGVHMPPPPPPKRKEHPEIDPLDSPMPLEQLPKRLKPSLTIAEKLEKLFDFLRHNLDWTLSELHLSTKMLIITIFRALSVTEILCSAFFPGGRLIVSVT
ncbi:hypothetical protein B0H14DRAFT_3646678 [Mycena olivaceomarginata]|nr:hypothetical protein B0H14DRAFT_3646678 [Mycena olivaceomarginata]